MRQAMIAVAVLLSACATTTNPNLPPGFKDPSQTFAGTNELEDCWLNHKADLQIGMTEQEVMSTCWNFVRWMSMTSTRRYRTTTAEHVYDQWVFKILSVPVRYAYFTDGVLTALQD